MANAKIIVITGTPCTGKTTLASELGKFNGAKVISASQVAIDGKCVISKTKAGEKVIDLNKLQGLLKSMITKESKTGPVVIEGHLLCEFKLPADKVIVLRCSPKLLEKRMKERRYPKEKNDGNLLAEMLDYCLIRSQESYGEELVVQVDCTRKVSAKKMLGLASSGKSERIDWMPLLLKPPFSRLATGGFGKGI